MTTPYRIVWHTHDPHNAHDTVGPGCRNGWITAQELLQPPGTTYYRTHIVRVLYAEWVSLPSFLIPVQLPVCLPMIPTSFYMSWDNKYHRPSWTEVYPSSE